MRLKKLILSGFKSFADKTELEFDAGISCVVGPNGCGKSNIVDAIKWVLGEQSAKSLRGGEMMDVIFNGSSKRNPSGLSSVTLVFENEDHLLQPAPNSQPLENPDTVEVTRRLYRSGQSEYLINKEPARLRDIKEMFLDTGVGAGAYSLIEQGRVTQFLQATQEERRAFFDEAAGISRYKQRRKEALRKLDRVEQNMARVQDILGEVEKRLRSIKLQAGKARNYQEYSQRLHELRSLYFLAQYHRMTLQRRDLQSKLDSDHDELASMAGRLEHLEAAQSAAEVESVELEQSARNVQSQLHGVSSKINSLSERVDVQSRRAEELSERIVANVARAEELQTKLDSQAGDLQRRQADLHTVQQDVETLQNSTEGLRDDHAAGELRITEMRSQIEDEKSGVVDLMRRVAQLHNEVQGLQLKRENLHGRRDRMQGRAEQIAQELETLTAEQAAHATKLDDIDEVIQASEAKLTEVKQQASGLADTEQKLGQRLSDLREERSTLQGRKHTLEEMQKRLEGVAEGTRRVLQARQDGKLAAIRGMVGDFVQTDVEHAPLVAAALAGADQRLLCEEFTQLQQGAGELDELLAEGGQVEIICLDQLRAVPTDDAAMLPPKVIGRVLDWLNFEEWLEPVMWQLLGRTFVVRDLADAVEAAAAAPGKYRFVTMAGEVLESEGMIRLGSVHHGAGVIGRRSELAELHRREQELSSEIDDLHSRCTQAKDEREHLDKIIHELRTALYEANYEKSETAKQVEKLENRLAELRREEPLVAQNIKAVLTEIEESVRTEQAHNESAAELERTRDQRESAVAELEQQLQQAQTRQAELTDRLNEMKIKIAAGQQRLVSLRESAESLRRQQDEMTAQLNAARGAVDLDRQRQAEAQRDVESAKAEIESLHTRHNELQEEASDLDESRQGILERLSEIRKELTSRRKSRDEAAERLSNLRVKFGEVDAHIGDMVNRAADEMGMDLVELYKTYEHDEQRDWQAVEDEINELRGKIDRLGNVNMDAIAEQEELEQREQFLQSQIEDITTSQRQLEDLVRKLNKESRQRFEETFTAVRENFQVLFRKLFGGGKADILLVDPEDILESPIEIVARPPGKELRSISLLSGGEKTMAALALIFGFFQARPSPFCLLDEVDAALDEANNERYNALVEEFAETSQFIMITHSKRTMAIGNVLYGVTMQEPGVSTRISVRFEEAARMVDGQPTQAASA